MQIVFKWTCHTYLPQYPSLLSPWPRLPDHPPRASQAGRRIASPARRVTSVKGFPAMHRFLPALLCILPLMPAPARGDRPRRVQRPRDEPAIGHAGAPRSVGFGPRYAAGIRRRPQTRDTWHLDAVFITPQAQGPQQPGRALAPADVATGGGDVPPQVGGACAATPGAIQANPGTLLPRTATSLGERSPRHPDHALRDPERRDRCRRLTDVGDRHGRVRADIPAAPWWTANVALPRSTYRVNSHLCRFVGNKDLEGIIGRGRWPIL